MSTAIYDHFGVTITEYSLGAGKGMALQVFADVSLPDPIIALAIGTVLTRWGEKELARRGKQ